MAFTKVEYRGLDAGHVGIRTAGGLIGVGFTMLNFIGAGNTFAVSPDGTTVDISIAGGGGGGSSEEIYKELFNVTSTQSVFTLSTGQFDEDFIDVYVNGVKLPSTDFTQNPPTQFTLDIAAEAGDTVEVVAFRTRSTNTDLNADITNLNASGIVTAGQFYGDGKNLTNLPVGIGTMLDVNTPGLDAIYYVNTTLGIGQTITVNPPDSSTSSFTHYTEIAVDPDVDFIVEDGDDFIADVLGLGDLEVPNLPGNGGRVRADNFTNKAGTGAPNFPHGLDIGDGSYDTGFLEVPNVLDVTTDKTVSGSSTSKVIVQQQAVAVADTKSLILGPDCELVINALQL